MTDAAAQPIRFNSRNRNRMLQMNVLIDLDLRNLIRLIAVDEDRSISQVCRRLLRVALAHLKEMPHGESA